MENINNSSIRNIQLENKKYIEIKTDKRDNNDEFLKKNEELIKMLKKEILEGEQYKEQNELKLKNNNINLLDDYQKEIINKLNSNFINCINDKFEGIKNYLNEQINIHINKQFEEILNQIKSNRVEIFNKCIENQDKIKKDIEQIIKDIRNIYNKLNFDKVQNNNNINAVNSNDNIYYDKKIINKNQGNSNIETFINSRIPKGCNAKRIINNNYSNNENQNNDKKKENMNDEETPNVLRTTKKDKKLDENNRNSFIFEDKNEYNTIYINKFLKKNNNINLAGNNLNNKNKIDFGKNKKEEVLNYNYNYINNKVNDRITKTKISQKTNDIQNQKLYQSINRIFFIDYQQKNIKKQKINEYKKEELQKEIFNDKISGRNILKNFYMHFIEVNVLPLFKKNYSQSKLEIIQYNISVILECLGMDKNYYNNYYYQYEKKKQNINRELSEGALLRFRSEFNISKEDYADEAIERRLIENNLDINKTFKKMFG